MIYSAQVEVDVNVTLLYEAQSKTRLTLRASSSGVRIGAKDLTWASGLSLTANVSRDIELQKGDGLYAVTVGNPRTVELLAQGEA